MVPFQRDIFFNFQGVYNSTFFYKKKVVDLHCSITHFSSSKLPGDDPPSPEQLHHPHAPATISSTDGDTDF